MPELLQTKVYQLGRALYKRMGKVRFEKFVASLPGIEKEMGCYPYCLDGDAATVTIRADKSCTVYVVDGADLEQHYRQSQAAERIGRDYMAYCLGQVKSHINNFYFKNNQRT